MRGINPTTGTVHTARESAIDGLVQTCGAARSLNAGQRAALVATEAELTCRRCIARAAKIAKSVQPAVSRQAAAQSATQRKVLAALAGKGWVSCVALWAIAGDATLSRMVDAGLIEANADGTQYQAL